MSESIATDAVKLRQRQVAINEEIKILDEENESLDRQKLVNVDKRKKLRQEREQISGLLSAAEVNQRIVTHEEATAKARADAEQLKADAAKLTNELAAKNKEADELLAKLKANETKDA